MSRNRTSGSTRSSAAPRSRNGAKRGVPRSSVRSTVVEWRPMRRSPSIRWSKVMTAQARIAVGYYEREEVKELMLEALMKELAPH